MNRETMLTRLSKCLMNAEGDSPGGGAPAPAPAAPTAEVGAQPAAPAAITADALNGAVAAAIAAALPQLKNGIFADLRKAGALKPDKQTEPTPTPAPTVATATPTQDVEAIIERRETIARVAGQHGLNSKQLAFMRQSLASTPLESIESAATSWVIDMGLAKSPTPATPTQPDKPTTAQPSVPATNPFDKGSAPPISATDPELLFRTRATETNADDFGRLVAQHGQAKALEIVQRNVNAYLKTVKLVPEGRQKR